MTSYRLTAASVFVFLAVCVGQAGGGLEAVTHLQLIHRVLDTSQVQGSLAYSSCGFHKRSPDDPPLCGFCLTILVHRKKFCKRFLLTIHACG